MSWGEVCKVNNKINKPINKVLLEKKYFPIRILSTTGTYKPEKTGLYRVICVGAGGAGSHRASSSTYGNSGGGGGGVAIKDMVLNSTTSYNVTVSTTASFGSALSATSGGTATFTSTASVEDVAAGGTASGGDYNFTGENGYSSRVTGASNFGRGGSVGVFIGELMDYRYCLKRAGNVPYGASLLGYGGGGTSSTYHSTTTHYDEDGLPAAVIIIPLELEA